MQGVPVLETQPTVSRHWDCRWYILVKLTRKMEKALPRRVLYTGEYKCRARKRWSHAVAGHYIKTLICYYRRFIQILVAVIRQNYFANRFL